MFVWLFIIDVHPPIFWIMKKSIFMLFLFSGDIDRCLKKVAEGVEQFEDIWQKVCLISFIENNVDCL